MELTMEKMFSIVGRLYITSNNLTEQLERALQELEQIKQESLMKDKAISALRDEINAASGKPYSPQPEQLEPQRWSIGPEKI